VIGHTHILCAYSPFVREKYPHSVDLWGCGGGKSSLRALEKVTREPKHSGGGVPTSPRSRVAARYTKTIRNKRQREKVSKSGGREVEENKKKSVKKEPNESRPHTEDHQDDMYRGPK